MHRMKYILSNVTVINLVLVGALVVFVRYMTMPYFAPASVNAMPQVKKPLEENSKAAKSEEKSPSLSDYIVIAEQNLFHPDRIIPVPKVEAPPLPKPEFILYGTLITDNFQVAYMDDKKGDGKKAPQGSKKQTSLRKGDSLSGFVLNDVTAQSVTMVRGEEKIVVSLNDSLKIREVPGGPPPPQHAGPGAPTAQTQAGTRPSPPAGNVGQPANAGQPENPRPVVDREKAVNKFRDIFKNRSAPAAGSFKPQ